MSKFISYIASWFRRESQEEYRAVRTEILITRPELDPSDNVENVIVGSAQEAPELINPIYKATENGPAGSAQEVPKEETRPSMEEVPANKVEEGIDDLGIQELSGDL